MGYPFQQIEPKWQKHWEQNQSFAASDTEQTRPKYYILDMFPYPSGAGLHVGHPEGYTATDIVARYKRLKGFNVLHPMGWDAFGLPAEQYAIETGTHPAETTQKNVENFKRQIQRLGFSYDWSREVNTTDPKYYRWTQWIFLRLYDTWFDAAAQKGRPISELPIPDEVSSQGEEAVKDYRDSKRLAYVAEVPVNWCAALGTVLANEEVIDGKSERGGHPVVRLPLKQWMLRITQYADRLLDGLDKLDWPDAIKKQQREWIGRSEGADVWFEIAGMSGESVESVADAEKIRIRKGKPEFKIYTTRPDTLFGVTYMVLSPEHSLVEILTTDDHRKAVEDYRRQSALKSEMERTDLAKEKTGVFTGSYAVNPVNHEKIPIWIADYVLATYGTGAIMAVPAHDQRDYEFARTFDLPVKVVIAPEGVDPEEPLTEAVPAAGSMVQSGSFDGLNSEDAKQQITDWLESEGCGQKAVNYKLRDWLFSRQRYWGEPFPVIWDEAGRHWAVDDNDLPVKLPEMEDFKPSGNPEPPLGKAKQWESVEIDGKIYRRELNTMPQWAGSCWYYLRYVDAQNADLPWDAAKEKYWLPVDLYIGGAEHAVLHLLYSRFWHLVLFDLGWVSSPEPYKKLVNQGLILGEDGEKMSKSRGNVVNPDDVIHEHGADAFRLYEMFMGPLEAVKPWSTQNIEGVDRFLNKVWRLIMVQDELNPAIKDSALEGDIEQLLHKTIKSVSDDIESLRLNTAISALMILTNQLGSQNIIARQAVEVLVILLAPFAPHLCEELWERLGHADGISQATWPVYDETKLQSSEIPFVVQVNGKNRAQLTISAEANDEEIKAIALAHESVIKHMAGKPIKKSIIVPKRLINLVV